MRGWVTCLVAGLVLVSTHVTGEELATAAPCPAQVLYARIANQYVACRRERSLAGCGPFVESFHKLASRYDCRRSFDTTPVPAAWLCEQADPKREVLFNYIDLLVRLDFDEAHVFFASPEFRSILDGYLAETYLPRSLSLEKALAERKRSP